MKTNEAPEKIYLIRNISTSTSLNTTNDCRDKYLPEWYNGREKDADIEYTRTDAFIEKVVKFIKNSTYGYLTYKNGDVDLDRDALANDFRKAMEE